MDDPALHAAKYQAYVEDRKTYKAKSSAWKENRTRAFMLFTAHCPEGLPEEGFLREMAKITLCL